MDQYLDENFVPDVSPGDEIEGVVVRVGDYSFFLKLTGTTEGMILKSSVPEHRLPLREGDKIKVRVREIRDRVRVLLDLCTFL